MLDEINALKRTEFARQALQLLLQRPDRYVRPRFPSFWMLEGRKGKALCKHKLVGFSRYDWCWYWTDQFPDLAQAPSGHVIFDDFAPSSEDGLRHEPVDHLEGSLLAWCYAKRL